MCHGKETKKMVQSRGRSSSGETRESKEGVPRTVERSIGGTHTQVGP